MSPQSAVDAWPPDAWPRGAQEEGAKSVGEVGDHERQLGRRGKLAPRSCRLLGPVCLGMARLSSSSRAKAAQVSATKQVGEQGRLGLWVWCLRVHNSGGQSPISLARTDGGRAHSQGCQRRLEPRGLPLGTRARVRAGVEPQRPPPGGGMRWLHRLCGVGCCERRRDAAASRCALPCSAAPGASWD
jgi:hypothetical protein